MPQLKIAISQQADTEFLELDDKFFLSLTYLSQLTHKSLQSLVEEALAEYIERLNSAANDENPGFEGVRPSVEAALEESLAEFDDLYRELAK